MKRGTYHILIEAFIRGEKVHLSEGQRVLIWKDKGAHAKYKVHLSELAKGVYEIGGRGCYYKGKGESVKVKRTPLRFD